MALGLLEGFRTRDWDELDGWTHWPDRHLEKLLGRITVAFSHVDERTHIPAKLLFAEVLKQYLKWEAYGRWILAYFGSGYGIRQIHLAAAGYFPVNGRRAISQSSRIQVENHPIAFKLRMAIRPIEDDGRRIKPQPVYSQAREKEHEEQ